MGSLARDANFFGTLASLNRGLSAKCLFLEQSAATDSGFFPCDTQRRRRIQFWVWNHGRIAHCQTDDAA